MKAPKEENVGHIEFLEVYNYRKSIKRTQTFRKSVWSQLCKTTLAVKFILEINCYVALRNC